MYSIYSRNYALKNTSNYRRDMIIIILKQDINGITHIINDHKKISQTRLLTTPSAKFIKSTKDFIHICEKFNCTFELVEYRSVSIKASFSVASK